MDKLKENWAEIVFFISIFIAIISTFSAISSHFEKKDKEISLQREIIEIQDSRASVYRLWIDFTNKKTND